MAGPRAREISLFDRQILTRASLDSVRKLTPRAMAKNPVMFVVEVGSVLTTALWIRDMIAPRRRRGAALVHRLGRALAVVHGDLRELRRGDRRGPRQGPGRHAAQDAQGDGRAAPARQRHRDGPGVGAAQGRRGDRRGRRADPRRRRRDRGRRERRRIGHHRRIGAGDPRERRRSLRGDGRHAGALGPARDPHQRQPRRIVPRAHDLAGRGRRAPEDARTRSRSTSCSRASPSSSCSRA